MKIVILRIRAFVKSVCVKSYHFKAGELIIDKSMLDYVRTKYASLHQADKIEIDYEESEVIK